VVEEQAYHGLVVALDRSEQRPQAHAVGRVHITLASWSWWRAARHNQQQSFFLSDKGAHCIVEDE
jgi:hypothetical protein